MADITLWDIEEDTIHEAVQASGTTTLIAHVPPRRNETANENIIRGMDACYRYLDPGGYSCVRNAPHPRNSERLSNNQWPIFCSGFEVKEETGASANPSLFHVTLNWAVPEQIEGLALEREPPRRIQHVVPKFSHFDPDTKQPHTTTAGEPIRGIQTDEAYGGLSYTLRVPRLPGWFRDMQRRPINLNGLTVGGGYYPPKTLWVARCEASPLKIKPGLFWEEIHLDLLEDPDEWTEKYPNLGHYELLLSGVKQVRTATGANGQPIYTRGAAVPIMNRITSQADADRYAEAARTGAVLNLPGSGPTRIFQNYVPIRTWLSEPYSIQDPPEIEDVTKPVPLDRNGLAYRLVQDGSPLQTTALTRDQIVINAYSIRLQRDLSVMQLW